MAKNPLCLNCTTTHDLTDGEYIQCMEIPTGSRLQASTPAALVRRVVVEACGAVTAWFGLVRGDDRASLKGVPGTCTASV